jgi:hypothetical protein
LRFALKRGLESLQQFRARINRAVTLEEEDTATAATAEEDGWYLGKTRDVGSVHSDIWSGSAAELMRRNALAVYPIAGWWKEKPQLGRYDRDVRYSLCVSLRALEAEDIYTPISTALGVPYTENRILLSFLRPVPTLPDCWLGPALPAPGLW